MPSRIKAAKESLAVIINEIDSPQKRTLCATPLPSAGSSICFVTAREEPRAGIVALEHLLEPVVLGRHTLHQGGSSTKQAVPASTMKPMNSPGFSAAALASASRLCPAKPPPIGWHFSGSTEGSSLVIDPSGRLWRARSYEDFATTYTITPTSCEIATLTPLYAEMREYVQREAAPSPSS
jgi:hypothetical protein